MTSCSRHASFSPFSIRGKQWHTRKREDATFEPQPSQRNSCRVSPQPPVFERSLVVPPRFLPITFLSAVVERKSRFEAPKRGKLPVSRAASTNRPPRRRNGALGSAHTHTHRERRRRVSQPSIMTRRTSRAGGTHGSMLQSQGVYALDRHRIGGQWRVASGSSRRDRPGNENADAATRCAEATPPGATRWERDTGGRAYANGRPFSPPSGRVVEKGETRRP